MNDADARSLGRLLRRILAFVGFVFATLFLAGRGRAQTAPGVDPVQQAAAQTLFDEAQRLRAERHLGEACAKFAESQRLDPAPGTLLNLARCYEETGHLASAWISYREATVLARRDGREQWAMLGERRAAALEARVPRISVRAPDSVNVSENGRDLGASAYGTFLPVDPGTVAVDAHANGKRPWHRDVVIGERDRLEIEVGPLEDEGAPARRLLEAQYLAPGKPQVRITQRYAGLSAGALGVIGVGFGAAFGVNAIMRKNDAALLCPTRAGCNSAAAREGAEARSAASISTALFAVGGVLVGTGTTLYLMAAPAHTSDRHGSVPRPLFSLAGTF